ncbi:FecR family protein [Larkinella arboricola]|uniref:FecR family protein n=1 Tax=Larkinella arboricola TaxID=643671 RepID=A0A327WTH0_LARAB|nr:FecR domain-containing protein [Larkinella arboricola]RAJ95803.1 FecR family protein [Larkinella arboricola]
MIPSVTKNLLFDHFAGRTTPLQKRLIEEWSRDEANQETFYQWLAEWEQQAPLYLPETDHALHRYRQHMENRPVVDGVVQQPDQSGHTTRNRPFWTRWLVAASALILLGLTGWLYRKTLLYESYRTDFGETRMFELADGSRVTLNANSLLQVPRIGFGNYSREVLLQGEAYFSVVHTVDDQKFIVKTDKGVDVVVLGTEFSVYARSRGAKVLLNKGKVQVRYEVEKKTGQVFLKPGDLLTIEGQRRPNVRTVIARKYAAWKDHRFLFENTKISELIEMLADIYGLKVEIKSEKLANRTLDGSFQAKNADEFLSVIAELLQITVHRQGHTVLFQE